MVENYNFILSAIIDQSDTRVDIEDVTNACIENTQFFVKRFVSLSLSPGIRVNLRDKFFVLFEC